MTSNIKEIVDFYKNGYISEKSFEAELGRVFSIFANVSVVLDDETTIGATNSSYVAMLIPEYTNDIIRHKLVIDSELLKNKLEGEDIEYIVSVVENLVPTSSSTIISFFNKNKGTDVSYGECILIYAKLYNLFLTELLNNENIAKIAEEKTVDMQKLLDVQLAIESGNESTQKAVEYINVHKLLPNQALISAEDLYQQVNEIKTVSKTLVQDIDKPVQNYWWTKLVSNTTGTFNPESRTVLDPDKDFINKK